MPVLIAEWRNQVLSYAQDKVVCRSAGSRCTMCMPAVPQAGRSRDRDVGEMVGGWKGIISEQAMKRRSSAGIWQLIGSLVEGALHDIAV